MPEVGWDYEINRSTPLPPNKKILFLFFCFDVRESRARAIQNEAVKYKKQKKNKIIIIHFSAVESVQWNNKRDLPTDDFKVIYFGRTFTT